MPSGRRVTIHTQPTDTIYSIKTVLQDTQGVPTTRLQLFFALQELTNERTLADYNIADADVLTAVVLDSTEGGCPSSPATHGRPSVRVVRLRFGAPASRPSGC